MSYDTLKVEAGRQRIDVVQVVVAGCSRTFGVAPCTATGEECFNSWETCKDTANYDAQDKTVTFCTPLRDIPAGYIPLLKPFSEGGVTFDPGDISPEDGVSKLGSVTLKFIDAPHDDSGIDPYVDNRSYSPLSRSTFWPKFRARWPHYTGRTLYWYSGYMHSSFSLANLKKRTYVIEKIEGFGRKSGVSIVAKDPTKLLDDKRAQFPPKSTGTLAAAITAVATPTTIDIVTENPTEYDLYIFEASSAVAMKDEVFEYTGTTIVTGGIRLTGVSRGPAPPYESAQVAHAEGDAVQKCAYWDDMRAPDIIRRLMVVGAGVDSALVPYSTWETLYDTWLAGHRLTRLVTKPTGVATQIAEVLQQSSSWGMWWDDVAGEYQYEVIRPAGLTETVVEITDDANIVAGSLVVSDDPDRLINSAVLWYGQVDPTKSDKETSNYSNAIDSVDVISVSDNEVGSYRIKTVFCAWHVAPNAAVIAEIADNIVLSRGSVPYKVEFELDRKDDALQTGDFVDVTSSQITDIYGAIKTTRFRVTKVDNAGEKIKYLARQDFASSRYALISPAANAGETWATADTSLKVKYMFIANSAGLYSDGSEGKRIY